jgi:ribosomal protein L37E
MIDTDDGHSPAPPGWWSILWPLLPIAIMSMVWLDSTLRQRTFTNDIRSPGVHVISARGALRTLHCQPAQLILPLTWHREDDGFFRYSDETLDIINSQNGMFAGPQYGRAQHVPFAEAECGIFKNGPWAQRFEVRAVPYGPLWCLTLLPAAIGITRLTQRQRWQRRCRDNRCPVCSYDWRTTPQRCPECGYGQAANDRSHASPDESTGIANVHG